MPSMLRPSNVVQRPSSALLALLAVVAAALASVASVGACASSSGGGSSSGTTDGGSSGTTDSGSSGSSGADSGGDSGGDAATVVVNDCNVFVDRSATGASRTITWDFPVSTAPERCMTIKKNQAVVFNGDFGTHPLDASGGDKPNPFASPDAPGKVTFAKAGLFGFQCAVHPSMTGAIKVIE